MIKHPKTFLLGAGLMAGFVAVFIAIFLPIYGGGKNGLDYMDSLYNSISKGSAYYIPGLKEKAVGYKGKKIVVNLAMKDGQQADTAALLFKQAGADVTVTGNALDVSGDMGDILTACLDDSDLMFHNDGGKVRDKYQTEEKNLMYHWYLSLKAMDKEFTTQKLFPEAKFVMDIEKRAVECAYNYYKVVPEKITAKLVIVIFSLVFYVIYTLWYGYAIMFMFEGWGMQISH